MSEKNKLLMYELNEVPWRVVDKYVESRPQSHLASLLGNSDQYTTHTTDSGELHPWSTWPTVHRGVSNDVHSIRFLNQDLESSEKWQPIWEILSKQAISVGIFGSLQSYPVMQHEKTLFHIPDTFAKGEETYPKKYIPFQRFNLKQTGMNKATTSNPGASDIVNAIGLLRCGISPFSFMQVVRQLFNEKRNKLHCSRRALLQPILSFDVFLDCLKRDQPDFVTFFSNHVAGIMHRYWKYSFPEDFNYQLADSQSDQFHANSIMVAMDIFDEQLGKLILLCDSHSYDLIVCSSMGQQAIARGDAKPELGIDSFETLKSALGVQYTVHMNLAMQPDIALEFESIEDLTSFRSSLFSITDSKGIPLFKRNYEPVGLTLNISISSSNQLAIDKVVLINEKPTTPSAIGLKLFERDVGTGYHQPKGILTWKKTGQPRRQSRETIDSRSIAPAFLQHFDVTPPSYMMEPLTEHAVPDSVRSKQR